MLHSLLQRIDSNKILDIQKFQYAERILLSDTVYAGQSKLGRVAISNLGAFLCQMITGNFQTAVLHVGSGHYEDDGISHLRGQLIDGYGNKKLFNDYIPLDLWLSGGRTKYVNATINGAAQLAISNNLVADGGNAAQAAASNNLFYPIEFEYLFSENSEIQLDVKNDSSVDLQYNICFHGIRILSSTAVKGVNPVSRR